MSSTSDAILERIGWHEPIGHDRDSLAGLQRAFLASVPFENLDVHRGVAITLDPDRIRAKIVDAHRGGFCYECNTVMYELLTALGFVVDRISCRMALREPVGAEFDHLALVVHLDRDYLVDVGNGQSAAEPLSLDGGEAIVSEGLHYRVGSHGDADALWYSEDGDDWKPRFLFTRRPRELGEFAGMCEHHQRSPESIFTGGKLATLPTPRGRVTYTGDRLTVTDAGRTVEERAVAPEEEAALLERCFGIRL